MKGMLSYFWVGKCFDVDNVRQCGDMKCMNLVELIIGYIKSMLFR